MKLLRLTRFRAFAMLLAIGLGLAAQLAATAAMAGPMAPTGEFELSASTPCPGCDGMSDMGTPAQCGTVFCWNMVAVQTSSALPERIQPAQFATAAIESQVGRALRPDPYPPRTTAHR